MRHARTHLNGLFPYTPQQSGHNERLKAALGLVERVIRLLAEDSDFWLDDCWIVDSAPVPCGMSRPTVKRSDLAGWAGYGYCASHSRSYWGLKLYLVCTPSGMPILWALANPKLGEREVLAAMLEVEAGVVAEHDGILPISDRGFAGKDVENLLTEEDGITLLRPSRKREQTRRGEPLLRKVRQLIESVNDTLKGQLDLEDTVAAVSRELPSVSPSACWPWPPPTGTTSRPQPRSAGRPTTTDGIRLTRLG